MEGEQLLRTGLLEFVRYLVENRVYGYLFKLNMMSKNIKILLNILNFLKFKKKLKSLFQVLRSILLVGSFFLWPNSL